MSCLSIVTSQDYARLYNFFAKVSDQVLRHFDSSLSVLPKEAFNVLFILLVTITISVVVLLLHVFFFILVKIYRNVV